MSRRRWFDAEVLDSAVRTLVGHSREPRGVTAVSPEREHAERVRNAALAAGGVLAFILLLVLVLGTFAKRKDPNWKPTPATYLFPGLLVVAAGAAAWHMTVQSQQRRRGCDRAFVETAGRGEGLTAIGGRRLVGGDVGTLPWFATEELVSDEQMNVSINLAGKHGQHDLVYVECTHVVDPMSGLPSLTRSLSSLAVSRMKRLALRGMDAAVFLEPLAELPDLLIVPNSDPTAGSYLTVVGDAAHELAKTSQVPQQILRKYWLATSEPHWLGPVFTERLTSLLSDREWCLIQVLGGHCVVMTRWLRKTVFSPPSRSTAQISADLDFATAVFEELRRYGAHAADADSPTAMSGPADSRIAALKSFFAQDESRGAPGAAVAARIEPASQPAQRQATLPDRLSPDTALPPGPAASPQPARSCLRVVAKGCAGLMGAVATFLGIFTLCMYGPDLFWGTGSEDWPTVEGTMVKSFFEEKKLGSSAYFSPKLSYTYDVEGETHRGERLQFGFRRAETRQMADELIAAYPAGSKTTVHYHPKHPGMATLRVGLYEPAQAYVGLGLGTCVLLMGVVLIWFSLPARRRRSHAGK